MGCNDGDIYPIALVFFIEALDALAFFVFGNNDIPLMQHGKRGNQWENPNGNWTLALLLLALSRQLLGFF